MIDIESTIFNTVAESFQAEYPNALCSSEILRAVATFPCMTLVEIDNYTYDRSLDAELTENDAWITYEANVYSNKQYGAKQECKEMMSVIDEQMFALGFSRLYSTQTNNIDTSIYRITARYRAVVSKDYIIYRR